MRKKENKAEKCRDCNKVVTDKDAGILCKLCERWFHATCQKISEDAYAFFKKNESMHWYCEICNRSVGKILQSLVHMSKRQDLLEEQMQKVSQEVREMREDIKMMKETAKETEVKLDTLKQS